MTSWSAVFVEVPEATPPLSKSCLARTRRVRLDDARENLQEAIELVLEANRTLAEEALSGNHGEGPDQPLLPGNDVRQRALPNHRELHRRIVRDVVGRRAVDDDQSRRAD